MIERLEFETVPAQWDGRDCHKMWNKINEIIDYINNEVEKRPKVLYGIENIHTGEITFNARGGAYQDKNAAYRKMVELGIKEHRLVEYKLEGGQIHGNHSETGIKDAEHYEKNGESVRSRKKSC